MSSSSSSKNETAVYPSRVVDPTKQTLREELSDLALESFTIVADEVVHYFMINSSEDLKAVADMKAEDRPKLTDAGKVRELIEQAHSALHAAAMEVQTQLEPSGVFEPIRAKRKLEAERAPKRELLERIVNNQYRIKFSDQVEDFNAKLREIINLPRGPMRYSMNLQGLRDDGSLLDALDLTHLQQVAPSDEELTNAWRAQGDAMRAKRAKTDRSCDNCM